MCDPVSGDVVVVVLRWLLVVVGVLDVAMRLQTAFHMQMFATRDFRRRNFPVKASLHLTSLHSLPTPPDQVRDNLYLAECGRFGI